MLKLADSNEGIEGWCPKSKQKNRTNSRNRRATFGMYGGGCRYRRKERNEDALRARLWELASERPRFGYRRLYIFPLWETAEEGMLHARERGLKQAEDICMYRVQPCTKLSASRRNALYQALPRRVVFSARKRSGWPRILCRCRLHVYLAVRLALGFGLSRFQGFYVGLMFMLGPGNFL
jgi:hypothetical protein